MRDMRLRRDMSDNGGDMWSSRELEQSTLSRTGKTVVEAATEREDQFAKT